jgi:uncharacterized protein (DUF2461 family)
VAGRKTNSKAKPAAYPANPYFSQEALDFLRKLKRNNRREWFVARRGV